RCVVSRSSHGLRPKNRRQQSRVPCSEPEKAGKRGHSRFSDNFECPLEGVMGGDAGGELATVHARPSRKGPGSSRQALRNSRGLLLPVNGPLRTTENVPHAGCFRPRLRHAAPARPTRPTPSRVRDAGSGTVAGRVKPTNKV